MKPKAIGTAFETMCGRWLVGRLGQDVERRALHGSADVGDLAGLTSATGLAGIVECKAGAQATKAQPANVAEWRRQTLAERGNSGAGFALLAIKTAGVGAATFGRTRCDVTVADLCRLMGIEPNARSEAVWVTLDLETACWCIEGADGL